MAIPTGKNKKELLKYFRKNKEELRDVINYLDDWSAGWRNEDLKFLQDLQRLEEKLLS